MLTSHGRHRFEELDSLRGVAAMIVVLSHVGLFWNEPYPIWRLRFNQSPFGVFMAGPDAVYLFFIMSGFVLFLPYLRPEGSGPYLQFLIKRVCRIYLPYLAALGVSIAADLLCYRPLDGMFPRWYGWHRPLPISAVWGHLLFIRHDGLAEFNPAFWSLVHEMRISIAFPVVAFLALRLSLAWGVIVSLALCVGGFLMVDVLHLKDCSTIGYSGLFVLGAVIARHLPRIRGFVEERGTFGRGMMLLAALVLLKSTHFLPERDYQFWAITPLHGSEVAIVMILALSTVHFKRLLLTAPLRWLGKVSYSLYLIHGVILYSLVSLFWKRTTHHLLLLSGGVAIALLVVGPFYRWIEKPSIVLGRLLTRRGHQPSGTAL
jgi:peptidoglycan/LPS O-acetylase OafA/YrhL